MDKFLQTEPCMGEMLKKSSNSNDDLRLVDRNLITSPMRGKSLEGDDSNRVKLDLNDKSSASKINSKNHKRHRSESESSMEDESVKPRPNSKLLSVLVKPNRQKQPADEAKRKALMESQRNDKQVFDRNRRMFGMLMGTLQQFKTEETDRERLTIKRSRIEEKLELAVEKEKACIDDKLDRVVQQRHHEETHSDGLKLDIMDRFKNWEHSHQHLCSYIQTQTRPKIFWLPKEHNSLTEKRLKETKDYFSLCVAERKAKLKKELDDFDNYSKLSNIDCQQASPKSSEGSSSTNQDIG